MINGGLSVAISAQAILEKDGLSQDFILKAMPETWVQGVFNAEIKQLMGEVTSTPYPHKEVFFRELALNAVQALDKFRNESITDQDKHVAEIVSDKTPLFVNIVADRTNSTLTIEDSGIGMTKSALINELGTLAKSSLARTMVMAGGSDINFSIGFYSAYLVSDKVQVVSKHYDGEQYVWTGVASGYFTVEEDTKQRHGEVKRGTKVILYLRKDQSEFLDECRLRELVSAYETAYGRRYCFSVAEFVAASPMKKKKKIAN